MVNKVEILPGLNNDWVYVVILKENCKKEASFITVGGGRLGEEVTREFGMDKYTVLYLKWITKKKIKWITNKDPLYSIGDTAPCYVADWMGGRFGGEWIHVYDG